MNCRRGLDAFNLPRGPFTTGLFFVLADVLPQEVRSELPSKGVIAYFDWVQKLGNRERLQAATKDWVRTHPAK